MTRRDELVARLENGELREELDRYTPAEQGNAVEFKLAMETIDPTYATPAVEAWVGRALDIIETARRLGDEPWNLTNEEWDQLDQVLNHPPAGLSYEKLIADLNLTQDKLNRTA